MNAGAATVTRAPRSASTATSTRSTCAVSGSPTVWRSTSPTSRLPGNSASVCGRAPAPLSRPCWGQAQTAYHANHIHLDLIERVGGYRLCQWDVLTAPEVPSVLLPPERPHAE